MVGAPELSLARMVHLQLPFNDYFSSVTVSGCATVPDCYRRDLILQAVGPRQFPNLRHASHQFGLYLPPPCSSLSLKRPLLSLSSKSRVSDSMNHRSSLAVSVEACPEGIAPKLDAGEVIGASLSGDIAGTGSLVDILACRGSCATAPDSGDRRAPVEAGTRKLLVNTVRWSSLRCSAARSSAARSLAARWSAAR